MQQSPSDDQTIAVNFCVSDTGLGMAEGLKTVTFNSSTPADQSTSRTFGGFGLGLSICKKLVEMMGGEIDVKSKSGVGSRFHFKVLFGVACQPL
ncbi:hypothetical protein DL239_10460 [Sedimentitalea sp. CY04]|uniref:Histidine kinase domain-containing protein n=1 Tax=Parasedimentitalea denitrificans TaxID=2211118 RepID=A0ABX0W750_9RHOB|nr:hypothetical protein [Sedimentitalea sp. CY04]